MAQKDFIAFRKELHRHPELSGKEKETRKRVKEFLEPTKPDKILSLKNSTGILFFYGTPDKGKQVMVRCELDALPIQEVNTFEHKSKKDGVAHKCGHDGHMTILSRLAYLLSNHRPKEGCVALLFQPAEENGKGAISVYEEAAFRKISFDLVLALHNVPGYPLGEILLRKGAITPAVCSLIIRFKGKTSHAAEPEKGLNPAKIMAEYTLKALALNHTNSESNKFLLITPIYQTLGEKSYGVSAGYGEVHLTIRSWENKLLYATIEKLTNIAAGLASDAEIEIETESVEEFMANQNASPVIDLIEAAATKLALKIKKLPHPMPWGEDFGLFTEHYTGAMFGLGSGEKQPALHNPDYDFPDALIETGSNIFFETINGYFNE